MAGHTDHIYDLHRATRFPLYVLLHTAYPCCRGRATLRAIERIPRETYERTCSLCGQRWTVERRTAIEAPGKRVDVLEWTPARGISGR